MNVEIGTVAKQSLFLGILVSNFRYWFFAVWKVRILPKENSLFPIYSVQPLSHG
jgi:hypothetical protein